MVVELVQAQRNRIGRFVIGSNGYAVAFCHIDTRAIAGRHFVIISFYMDGRVATRDVYGIAARHTYLCIFQVDVRIAARHPYGMAGRAYSLHCSAKLRQSLYAIKASGAILGTSPASAAPYNRAPGPQGPVLGNFHGGPYSSCITRPPLCQPARGDGQRL